MACARASALPDCVSSPDLRLVQPAHRALALLDPRVAREVGIIAAYLLDVARRVLAADENIDGRLTEPSTRLRCHEARSACRPRRMPTCLASR